MGIGRIRARRRVGRQEESAGLGRTHRVRRARHERVRGVAEDRRARHRGHPPGRRRSLLETRAMKAGEILDRIKEHLGVPWRETTYRDTYKWGNADTEVTGIATTAFVTLDVIQRAAAAGLNM